MRFGTTYFRATRCANEYYAQQGFDAEDVQDKISEGEVTIGAPSCLANERTEVDQDGRYWIVAA